MSSFACEGYAYQRNDLFAFFLLSLIVRKNFLDTNIKMNINLSIILFYLFIYLFIYLYKPMTEQKNMKMQKKNKIKVSQNRNIIVAIFCLFFLTFREIDWTKCCPRN